MGKTTPTRDEIIHTWKKLDAESDAPVGVSAVATVMGISKHWFWKLFAGESLSDIKRQHGIRLSPQEIHRTADELCSELDRVVSEQKCIPTWHVLNRETGVPESTWKKRIGGRKGCSQKDVYGRYAQWLQATNPTSVNLEIVARFLEGPSSRESACKVESSQAKGRRRIRTYQKGIGREYGRLLRFGNLTYEPTNEQGVVFLFGMVSRELGFESIEYLGTDFPDCEAKWRVGNQGRLQHVKIEFEFKSRNYDHPVDGCDVIVCWEDNWQKDCPLPVIELKKEIKALRDKPQR